MHVEGLKHRRMPSRNRLASRYVLRCAVVGLTPARAFLSFPRSERFQSRHTQLHTHNTPYRNSSSLGIFFFPALLRFIFCIYLMYSRGGGSGRCCSLMIRKRCWSTEIPVSGHDLRRWRSCRTNRAHCR
ncbi:hypothetical protein F5Y07DRAFT_140966 [Xylaria sp. FL0933]|nr:hypothetical protein F5Y07DRAFT_140966 [Xylaria sp. FL0933]